MFYYEEMNRDILFQTGFDFYKCECWNGVSFRCIKDKDMLMIATNCYDKGLRDFINTYGKFDIKFVTSAKDSDGNERYVLNNIFEDMRLLLHQNSFKCDSLTENIFVFGNDLTTEQDAINILNEELKEEIIKETLKRFKLEISRIGSF